MNGHGCEDLGQHAGRGLLRTVLKFASTVTLEFGLTLATISGMKILTDDPDWMPDVYKALALALTFTRKYGRPVQDSPCLEAIENGLTVRYHASPSLVRLTVNTTDARVLSIEWKDGDA